VTPGVPDGWIEHEADGLVLALPEDWTVDPADATGDDYTACASPADLVGPDEPAGAELRLIVRAHQWAEAPALSVRDEQAARFEVPGVNHAVVRYATDPESAAGGMIATVQVRQDGGSAHLLNLRLPSAQDGGLTWLTDILGTLRFEDGLGQG
jgi:hypothetical protein